MKEIDFNNRIIYPIIPQEQKANGWCGPSVLSMAYQAFGITRNEDELAQDVNFNPEIGMDEVKMKERLRKDGFQYWEQNNLGWDQLKQMRRILPYPIIVEWWDDREGEPDGHYSLVDRVTDEHVVIIDPAKGAKTTFDKAYWMSHWQDIDKGYNGWCLVVKRGH